MSLRRLMGTFPLCKRTIESSKKGLWASRSTSLAKASKSYRNGIPADSAILGHTTDPAIHKCENWLRDHRSLETASQSSSGQLNQNTGAISALLQRIEDLETLIENLTTLVETGNVASSPTYLLGSKRGKSLNRSADKIAKGSPNDQLNNTTAPEVESSLLLRVAAVEKQLADLNSADVANTGAGDWTIGPQSHFFLIKLPPMPYIDSTPTETEQLNAALHHGGGG